MREGLEVAGGRIAETLSVIASAQLTAFLVVHCTWNVTRKGKYVWSKAEDRWQIEEVEVMEESVESRSDPFRNPSSSGGRSLISDAPYPTTSCTIDARPGALMFALACLTTGAAGASPDGPDAAEFFEKQIRPLLVEKCHKCHGAEKARGGLSLAGRDLILKGGDSGPAAVPGKPKESLLVEALEHRGELKMPPKGKLSAAEIDRVRRWIEIGLPWPGARATSPAESVPDSTTIGAASDGDASQAWWSFRPLRRAVPPAVGDAAWPRTAIDRFILAGLEAKGLNPPCRPIGARFCDGPRST